MESQPKEEIEQAFKRMEENGVPKDPAPRDELIAQHAEEEKPLKLSPQDFRIYNRMAEHMDMFHENFRRTWHTLHTACTTNRRPAGMSIKQFLTTADQFCHHLTIHHTIEEQHIFPVLARKMPQFEQKRELLKQHEQIHEGLEKLEKLLGEVRRGERELVLREMGEVMEGFGKVLWEHLDNEVKELGAENMQRFWSREEMRSMPM